MDLQSSQIQLFKVMGNNFWMLYLIILCNPQYNSLLWGNWPTGQPYSHTAPSKTNFESTVKKTVEEQTWEGLMTDS